VAVLSRAATAAITSSAWFSDPGAPYLLLDTRLRICEVNPAYERATGQPREALLRAHLFDAFPDNPADPAADGVANLSASLERVLRTGTRSWMAFQRYDVPDLEVRGAFVRKIWAPVNAPVTEDGRTVALLHHVQDVTEPLQTVPPPPVGSRPELDRVVRRLARAFPEVPAEAVLAVLTQSELVVLRALGAPDADRTTDLARLRLELRTGHPARPTGDGVVGDRPS
jgi:hypothetical protein